MTNTNEIIDINHNQKVAAKLQEFLAQSYATLLHTQNLHWNIEGANFYSVHKLTEEMYTEQFAAIDEVAERLRTLGHKAQTNFEAYTGEATLESAIQAQQAAAQIANELLAIAADHEDEGTVAIAGDRLQVFQKNVWLLKSQA